MDVYQNPQYIALHGTNLPVKRMDEDKAPMKHTEGYYFIHYAHLAINDNQKKYLT